MAYFRCAGCGQEHDLNTAGLIRLVELLMAGEMHIVSKDYPARWEPVNQQERKTVQIKAVCAMEGEGIHVKATRAGPRKWARKESDATIRDGG